MKFNFKILILTGLVISVFFSCRSNQSKSASRLLSAPLYEFQDLEPRWNSFENPTSGKGTGGRENRGAKGHPYDFLKAGETKVLMNVTGAGIINRMWFTIQDRSPQMLRSLKIEMYWDGEEKPAVSVPFGDFFGNGLARMVAHESELFSSAEGRSFNCFIPMPFREGAKVSVTNEGDRDLDMLFYDINFVKLKNWSEDNLYFHCYWNRDTATTPGVDYTILPGVNGKGRFLGVNFGVMANPVYQKSWWGEGEVKMYLDGDVEFPTLIGTGTEDYIGTAWGQGAFINRYMGCPVADTENDHWTFYRYHIPDPIFFNREFRADIQAMGGNMKDRVIEFLDNGAPLIPVTIQEGQVFMGLMDSVPPVDLRRDDLMNGWTNFYRSDDWSSTAFFYLDQPSNQLPELANVKFRTYRLQ
jgi:hypothetical protein